jgi:hypothetical protein
MVDEPTHLPLPHGHPKHDPTPEMLKEVEGLSAMGVRRADIAGYMEISETTLRKYYGKELDNGALKANFKVAQTLYNQAVTDKNVTAMIFWLKSRAGWIDRTDHRISGTGPNGEIEHLFTRIEVTVVDADGRQTIEDQNVQDVPALPAP